MAGITVANILEEGRWGGPQSRVVNVSSRLHDYDISTVVIHPKSDSVRLVKELERLSVERQGLELYRLTKHVPTLLNYLTNFASEIFSLSRALKETNADLVHCNGAWQIKGMLAARRVGIPAVWHLNDTSMPAAVRIIFRLLAPHLADGFITASDQTRVHYIEGTKLGRKPYATIQAPVNTKKYDPEKVPAHSELEGIDGLKVVTVASVTPAKGLEHFIDMSSKVEEALCRDVHFFIVGPIHDNQSEYVQKLRDRASNLGCNNVHFTGHSDRVDEVLKATDLYVCSSRTEASPISVWEAMAMRLPIVSTDVGDVRRFVERDGARGGSVVKVGDSEALAEEALRFLRDRDLRRTAGQHSRETACSRLDLTICAKKHNTFYQQVISQKDHNE